MIRLERCHLLLVRSAVRQMLLAAGVDPRGLDLSGLHATLRMSSDPAALGVIDHFVVVPDDVAVPLAVRFQEEVAALDLDPEFVPFGSWVVPRTLALLRMPDLGCLDDATLTTALRRVENPDLLVVPDIVVAPALTRFNVHLRDEVPHGWSERSLLN